MTTRNYTWLDRVLIGANSMLEIAVGKSQHTASRDNPSADHGEHDLSAQERRHSAGLMRINHAGEVAAQALYQGQALTANLANVREQMTQAAREEQDHLAWCEQRLHELGDRTSWLNPLWYGGSFAIGALAGAAGDAWSLGFVAETERQVMRHLEQHLATLPTADAKSRAILEQMKIDEGQHATMAVQAGGKELPEPIKRLMGLTSKVMTSTAYWL